MVRKVEVRLIDDLDNSPADESVTFGLDGTNYQIDLSAKHAKELRAGLDKFIQVAQRVSHGAVATARPRGRGRAVAKSDRVQNQAIREWAQRNGLAVAPRGRISQSIVGQYQLEAGRSEATTKRRKS